MSAHSQPVTVVSSTSPRSNNARTFMIAAIVLIVGLGVGFFVGQAYKEKSITDSVTSSRLNMTENTQEVSMFGKTVQITSDTQKNEETLNSFFAGVSDKDLQKASYDDLIMAYGYANTAGNKEFANKVKATLEKRSDEFKAAEQKAIKQLGSQPSL